MTFVIRGIFRQETHAALNVDSESVAVVADSFFTYIYTSIFTSSGAHTSVAYWSTLLDIHSVVKTFDFMFAR